MALVRVGVGLQEDGVVRFPAFANVFLEYSDGSLEGSGGACETMN